MIGWLDETTDIDSEWFAEVWPDAPNDDDTRDRLLQSAYETCLPYASFREPWSERCKLAQVMQARAQQRNAAAGAGDQTGPDGYTVTVYPMDRTVKGLLRPRTGRPVVL